MPTSQNPDLAGASSLCTGEKEVFIVEGLVPALSSDDECQASRGWQKSEGKASKKLTAQPNHLLRGQGDLPRCYCESLRKSDEAWAVRTRASSAEVMRVNWS